MEWTTDGEGSLDDDGDVGDDGNDTITPPPTTPPANATPPLLSSPSPPSLIWIQLLLVMSLAFPWVIFLPADVGEEGVRVTAAAILTVWPRFIRIRKDWLVFFFNLNM